MDWPMKVARNAPAMPSTVVRMNPLGLFGPGESSRAIIPAMKPTMMMWIMAVVPFEKPKFCCRCRLISDPPRQFVFGRQPSFRRQMVDDIGQMLAQPRQQFLARQAALRGERIE